MGVSSDLLDIIEGIGIVAGELDNIMEAALRDIGQLTVDETKANWPQFGGPRPPSLRANSTKVPTRTIPHSARRWRLVQSQKLMFTIVNDAKYTSFVHIKKGHPNGLAADLITDILDEIAQDPLAALSDQVHDAIVGGVP